MTDAAVVALLRELVSIDSVDPSSVRTTPDMTSADAADLAARLGRALGTAPTLDAPYWMEAPLRQALCPTLVCGPSGGGPHAVDDGVDLVQLRSFKAALVEVLSSAD